MSTEKMHISNDFCGRLLVGGGAAYTVVDIFVVDTYPVFQTNNES